MKNALFLACLLTIILVASSAHAGELELRAEITAKVLQLFENEQFDELDQMAEKFLKNEERTPSGVWKSTIFSNSLGSVNPPSEFPMSSENKRKWDALFAKLKRWLKQSPNSVAAQNFYAKKMVSYAWSFRGEKYAYAVPDAAWPIFYQKLERAKSYMIKVKDNASIDPMWYITMVQIMKGMPHPQDEVDALIEEGLKRYPTYYQLYFDIIDYLLPKWHGNKHMIEVFAVKSTERTKEIEGMGLYARIYWVASQYNYGDSLFTQSEVVWPKMKAGIKDVLKTYPDAWNINNFAHFSCLAKDKEMTRELISQIKNPMIKDVWKDASFYEHCKAWSKK